MDKVVDNMFGYGNVELPKPLKLQDPFAGGFDTPVIQNPQVLTEEEKKAQSVSNVELLRGTEGKEEFSPEEFEFNLNAQMDNLLLSKKIPFTIGVDTPQDALHRVGSGKYVAKYPTYFIGRDNEDIYARSQSTGEKWANGISKNTKKAGYYLLGGTAGFAGGIASMITEGRKEAFYDNKFTEWVDEQTKRLDYELPNYVSQEERNMSLWRQAFGGSANFWANDVAGGAAFMLGALGSEAIWAAATGGSSLAMAGAKWGLKSGLKGIVKAAANKEILVQSAKQGLKGLQRSVFAGRTGQILNNARFIATSSGFESGVEARAVLDESLEGYLNNYRELYGELPSQAEISEFLVDATSKANGTFAANMAIVGGSNFLQFGRMFGLYGKIMPKTGSYLNRKLFGLGIDKTTKKAITPTRLQKFAGRAYSFGRAPFIEGVYEEGLQGVASNYSANMLKAKYDPYSMNEQYSSFDAIMEGFEETYGTKEGLKEVFIGAIIGKAGGVVSNISQGINPLRSGYTRQVQGLQVQADAMEKTSNNLSASLKNLVDRQLLFNQQINQTNASTELLESQNQVGGTLAFDAAAFASMRAYDSAGMLEENKKDFELMLERMDNTALAREFGVAESQVAGVKESILKDFHSQIEIYEKASEVAELLNPVVKGDKKRGLKENHYSEELATNIFLGLRASDRLHSIGQAIEESTGISGFADMASFYQNLSPEQKKNLKQLKRSETLLARYEQELIEANQAFSSAQAEVKRMPENIEASKSLEKAQARALKAQERVLSQSAERDRLRTIADTNPATKGYDFGLDSQAETIPLSQLVEAETELSKLDGFIDELSKNNKEAAIALNALAVEFQQTSSAVKGFHDTFQKLADQRFNFQSYKGVMRLFGKLPKRFTDPESAELTPFQQQVEAIITESKLNEYEAFNFRLATYVAEQNRRLGTELFSLDSLKETVSDEVWNTFNESGEVSPEILTSIAERADDRLQLTQRETRILEANEQEVAQIQKANAKQRGDSLRKRKQRVQTPTTAATTTEAIKSLIDQVIANINYLNGMGVSEFTRDDIVSEEEFREFNKLQKELDRRGKLSKNKQARYDELQDKINDFGKIEGAFSFGYSLIGLYQQLFQLEDGALPSQTITDGAPVTADVEVETLESTRGTPKQRHYNILQSYDKVVFSVDEVGNVVVHNINASGFLQEALKGVSDIKIFIDGKEYAADNIPKTAKVIRVVTLDPVTGAETSVMKLRIGEGGTIVMNREAADRLGELGSVRIGAILTNSKVPTNYSSVMVRREIDGEVVWQPLESNFYDPTVSNNVSEVQSMRKGDTALLEVNMADPYNVWLVSELKKGNITQEEFSRKLVIRAVDKNGNLIGVIKEERENHSLGVNPAHLARIQELRAEAAQMANQNIGGTDVLLLNSRLGIEHVFLGHPDIKIKEEGGSLSLVLNRFNPNTADKVTDIGYIENGKLVLRNSTPESKVYSNFVSGIMTDKQGRYKDKKVPVVVFSFAGRNIAYPVQLVAEPINLTADLNDIVSNEELTHEEVAMRINTLLMEAGIDVEPLMILPKTWQSKLPQIEQLLANVNQFPSVEEWVSSETGSIPEFLQGVLIDIDLGSNMFHSPKVVVDLSGGRVVEETEPTVTEEFNVEGEQTDITNPEINTDIQFSNTEQQIADIERRRQEELEYANFGNRQKEIQEGRENTKKIFDNLKQKYPANTLTGQVLRLLEKLIDINRISTISEKNHQSARGGKANGSAFEGGIILDSEIFDRVLNGEERAVKTFIHELFHQILNTSQFEAHKRGENTDLSSSQIKAWENLERLYEKAKNISNAKSEYGFTNLSEFLAEAFSNQGFQKELSDIKGEGKDTTLFKEILNSLLDFFKESLSKWAKRFNKPIPEINSGLLQDVMYWSEQLLDINKPYAPDLTTKEINAKYDAELASLPEAEESTEVEKKLAKKKRTDGISMAQVIREQKERRRDVLNKDPENAREAVIHWFARGNKLTRAGFTSILRGNQEIGMRLSMINNKTGYSMDGAVHAIWEENGYIFDELSIRDEFEDIVLMYHSAGSMVDSLVEVEERFMDNRIPPEFIGRHDDMSWVYEEMTEEQLKEMEQERIAFENYILSQPIVVPPTVEEKSKSEQNKKCE